MKVCDIPWCVAFATDERHKYCIIHREKSYWRSEEPLVFPEGEYPDDEIEVECSTCDGTGDCETDYWCDECDSEHTGIHQCNKCEGDGVLYRTREELYEESGPPRFEPGPLVAMMEQS